MAKKRKIKKEIAQQAKLSKIEKDPQKEKVVKIEEVQEVGNYIDPEVDKAAMLAAEKAVKEKGLNNNDPGYNATFYGAYAEHVFGLAPAA